MTTCLVFDIETRPNEALWSDPDFCNEIRDSIKPDGRIKDPVKIEADIDEKFEKQRLGAALTKPFGKVAAIACCELDSDSVRVWSGDDEHEVLFEFADVLHSYLRPISVGGFNIREFDIPWITFRCGVHGIELPQWWPHRRRSWDSIVDPVDLFGRDGRLDDHLRAFGLPRKTALGEESLTMSMAELADYCANDVKVEAALIRKLRLSFEALNPRRPAWATKPSGIGADPVREMTFSAGDLMEMPGVGQMTVFRIRNILQKYGYRMRGES